MIKEKIIVANGISETEYLRSMAKKGINTLGTRVMSPYKFALYCLEKNGIYLNDGFVASSNESALVYNDLKKINYYKDLTYTDSIKLFNSLDNLRMNILSDEVSEIKKLSNGEFKNKNAALIDVYNLYQEKLNGVLDTISTIRYAIASCKKIDSTVVVLREFPLKPLEKYLVESLSNNYTQESISLNKPVKINNFVKSFGIKNEVEFVINEILTKNIPLDQAIVVCPEATTYPKFFADICDELNIPYTTGISFSMDKTNTGRLYNLILSYLHDYQSKEMFMELVNDYSFNKKLFLEDISFNENNIAINKDLNYLQQIKSDTIFEAIGSLRPRFDLDGITNTYNKSNKDKINDVNNLITKHLKEYNEKDIILAKREETIYSYVSKAIDIISKGIVNFLEKYTKPNKMLVSAETKVLESITNLYAIMVAYNIPENEIEDCCRSITAGSAQSAQGNLYITTIKKALTVHRPYTFIVGLSSNNFPGSPKEDNVLLDSDYELFNIKDYSKKVIEDKITEFNNLIDIVCSNDSNVYLSYSYYNEQSLKDQNASSVVFEVYKKVYGDTCVVDNMSADFSHDDSKNLRKEHNDNVFKVLKFFDFNLNKNKALGSLYSQQKSNVTIKGDEVVYSPVEINVFKPVQSTTNNDTSVQGIITFNLSASKLVDYVTCPYYFYLKDILKLNEDWNNGNDMGGIPANDLGTLVHLVLENYKTLSKNDFINKGLELFDEYLVFNVPFSNEGITKKRDELKDILTNAFDIKSNDPVVTAEEDIKYKYNETLTVHGLPDCVIQSGNDIIVQDYKIKNSIEHNTDDLDSMIQIVLYCYILNKAKNINVTGAQYLYIKQNKVIKVNDLSESFNHLQEKLNNLTLDLKGNSFIRKITKDCDYCKLKDICKAKKGE